LLTGRSYMIKTMTHRTD